MSAIPVNAKKEYFALKANFYKRFSPKDNGLFLWIFHLTIRAFDTIGVKIATNTDARFKKGCLSGAGFRGRAFGGGLCPISMSGPMGDYSALKTQP